MVPHVAGAPGGYPDYGCAVHIRKVRLLPDGRSYVDCVGEGGGRRFRVVQREMSEGGYAVAQVEWLRDDDEGRELEVEEGSSKALALDFLSQYVNRVFLGAASVTLEDFKTQFESDFPPVVEDAGAGGDGRLEREKIRLLTAFLGSRVISRILQESLPSVPALNPTSAQEWLWWITTALPCSDGIKYNWLRARSWGSRMEGVAAFLQGNLETPFSLFSKIGEITQRNNHCGIQ